MCASNCLHGRHQDQPSVHTVYIIEFAEHMHVLFSFSRQLATPATDETPRGAWSAWQRRCKPPGWRQTGDTLGMTSGKKVPGRGFWLPHRVQKNPMLTNILSECSLPEPSGLCHVICGLYPEGAPLGLLSHLIDPRRTRQMQHKQGLPGCGCIVLLALGLFDLSRLRNVGQMLSMEPISELKQELHHSADRSLKDRRQNTRPSTVLLSSSNPASHKHSENFPEQL